MTLGELADKLEELRKAETELHLSELWAEEHADTDTDQIRRSRQKTIAAEKAEVARLRAQEIPL